MSNRINRQVRLAARPEGLPKPNDWTIVDEPVVAPGPGEVLVKVRYISVDPAMRGWMNDRASYIPPVGLGAVMRALTVSEVVESNNASYQVGDWVAGVDGVQDYMVSDGAKCRLFRGDNFGKLMIKLPKLSIFISSRTTPSGR